MADLGFVADEGQRASVTLPASPAHSRRSSCPMSIVTPWR